MSSEPLLECKNLSCGYRDRLVLENIDLTVRPGETIALLGPNGSGKSTLLRTISKLLDPLKGSIAVQGTTINSLSVQGLARLVSVTPQEEPTPFPFTVREIVTLGRLSFGTGIFDTADDRTAAERAMDVTDCLHLADRPIDELSGGEKQRVLIARTIAQDTPLVLMDEPTSHLDAQHQILVASLIGKMAQAGKAVIAAVHDLNLAPLISSRALLLSSGRIVLDAAVEQVLESPILDETYKTPMERVRTSSGRLLVTPMP